MSKEPKNKVEKNSPPKRRMTVAQFVFAIFALLIIVSMVLSAISMTF